MALTATATADVEVELKNAILHNAVIQKVSMDCPNIALYVDKLVTKMNQRLQCYLMHVQLK